MNNLNKLLLATFLIGSSQSFAGQKVDESLSANNITSVMIENQSGDVTVIGWDKAEVTVKGEMDDDVEKLVFEHVDGQIIIKVELPKRRNWGSLDTELVIHMPKNIRMDFDGISSNVDVDNLSNSVNVKTISGDIDAKNLNKHIELSSISGNVSVSNAQGKINLSVISGNINDKNSTGRLQLQAVSGDISSHSAAKEVFVQNVSGDTTLTLNTIDELKISVVSGETQASLSLAENGVVKTSSVSGDIALNFNDDIQAEFLLKASAGGDLVNKITNQKAKHAKYGPSAKLNFQTGNANGSVRADTVSGEIVIK